MLGVPPFSLPVTPSLHFNTWGRGGMKDSLNFICLKACGTECLGNPQEEMWPLVQGKNSYNLLKYKSLVSTGVFGFPALVSRSCKIYNILS